jgi:hypothetical protein
MAEQLLDCSDVVAVLQQVSGERVPQRMAARRLCDSSVTQRLLYGALDDGLMEMMTAPLPGDRST